MRLIRTIGIAMLMLMLTASFSFAAKAPETPETTAQPVIGKLHLKAGAEVLVLIQTPGGQFMPFGGTAFEDQTFYIIERIDNDGGKGYKADATGFAHNCQVHGREVFEENIFILVADGQVDGVKIKVEIFEVDKK